MYIFRCCCIDLTLAPQMVSQWSVEMDSALVTYVNKLCLEQAISPARLHPHEIYLTNAHTASQQLACLQGKPSLINFFLSNEVMIFVMQ